MAGCRAGVVRRGVSTYAWILTLHLAAIAVWIGGMLANALALVAVPRGGPPPAFTAIRAWNRRVTLPAMVLTWAAGASMAIWAGWYAEGWLWAKLVLVTGLAGLFGAQTATLRRLAAGRPAPQWMQVSLLAIVAALPIIATLAVTKPF